MSLTVTRRIAPEHQDAPLVETAAYVTFDRARVMRATIAAHPDLTDLRFLPSGLDGTNQDGIV